MKRDCDTSFQESHHRPHEGLGIRRRIPERVMDSSSQAYLQAFGFRDLSSKVSDIFPGLFLQEPGSEAYRSKVSDIFLFNFWGGPTTILWGELGKIRWAAEMQDKGCGSTWPCLARVGAGLIEQTHNSQGACAQMQT
jgi:hypothetical protein